MYTVQKIIVSQTYGKPCIKFLILSYVYKIVYKFLTSKLFANIHDFNEYFSRFKFLNTYIKNLSILIIF